MPARSVREGSSGVVDQRPTAGDRDRTRRPQRTAAGVWARKSFLEAVQIDKFEACKVMHQARVHITEVSSHMPRRRQECSDPKVTFKQNQYQQKKGRPWIPAPRTLPVASLRLRVDYVRNVAQIRSREMGSEGGAKRQ